MTGAWVIRYPDGRIYAAHTDRIAAERLLQPGYGFSWEELPNG